MEAAFFFFTRRPSEPRAGASARTGSFAILSLFFKTSPLSTRLSLSLYSPFSLSTRQIVYERLLNVNRRVWILPLRFAYKMSIDVSRFLFLFFKKSRRKKNLVRGLRPASIVSLSFSCSHRLPSLAPSTLLKSGQPSAVSVKDAASASAPAVATVPAVSELDMSKV